MRARSARFRVAALDATRFYAHGLARAAASASDAGWRVADRAPARSPADAASHAAAKQLANAPAFVVVERAVERVFRPGFGVGGGTLCFSGVCI